MIKYVATVKIKGTDLNRTIKAKLYKLYYMTDDELEETERELKKRFKRNIWRWYRDSWISYRSVWKWRLKNLKIF